MRQYQEDIMTALYNRGNWMGNNTSVTTTNGVSEVVYYRTKIAVVNHIDKIAKFDNGGYNNAATTARINAVKEFCKEYNYKC